MSNMKFPPYKFSPISSSLIVSRDVLSPHSPYCYPLQHDRCSCFLHCSPRGMFSFPVLPRPKVTQLINTEKLLISSIVSHSLFSSALSSGSTPPRVSASSPVTPVLTSSSTSPLSRVTVTALSRRARRSLSRSAAAPRVPLLLTLRSSRTKFTILWLVVFSWTYSNRLCFEWA